MEAILLIFFHRLCISQPDISSFQCPIWPSDFPSPLPKPPNTQHIHLPKEQREEEIIEGSGRGCFSTVVEGLLQTWPCQNPTVHTHTWSPPPPPFLQKSSSRDCSLLLPLHTHKHTICSVSHTHPQHVSNYLEQSEERAKDQHSRQPPHARHHVILTTN